MIGCQCISWRAGAKLLSRGWDAASARAAAHGRPEWARALATGYVGQPAKA